MDYKVTGQNYISNRRELGPLAQSAERGADNAKVVRSTLTRTNPPFCFAIFSSFSLKSGNQKKCLHL